MLKYTLVLLFRTDMISRWQSFALAYGRGKNTSIFSGFLRPITLIFLKNVASGDTPDGMGGAFLCFSVVIEWCLRTFWRARVGDGIAGSFFRITEPYRDCVLHLGRERWVGATLPFDLTCRCRYRFLVAVESFYSELDGNIWRILLE